MVRRNVFVASVSAVFVCLSAVAILMAADKSPPASPDEALRKLQERVAQLEARVNALEQRQPNIALPPESINKPIPKGWEQREFNGMEYYIVPVHGGNK